MREPCKVGGCPSIAIDGDVLCMDHVRLRARWEHQFSGRSFGDAIHALKAGKKVMRAGWNGKGMWLALQVPDAHSKMGLPYIYMSTVDGKLVPWLASQTDMLTEDWSLTA